MVESLPTDWKKAILDDTNFEQKTPFNYELCVSHLEKAAEDIDNLNPYFLFRGIWEITKSFKVLSSALSVGFGDITDKCTIWRNHFKNKHSDKNNIQEVMKAEIDSNLHQLNGDNNSKFGHKKKTEYYEYISGTRTLLRLTWFLDFFTNILTLAVNEQKKGFSDCIKMAYDKALAPHHGFMVRTAAKAGMSFAPSKREKAMIAFFNEEKWDDSVILKMNRWSTASGKLRDYLQKTYETKKLLELP